MEREASRVRTEAAAAFLAAQDSSEKRAQAYKERQAKQMEEELATMREERADLTSRAHKITFDLDEFETRFLKEVSGSSTKMTRNADGMEKLINEITASSSKAIESLALAAEGLEAFRQRQLLESENEVSTTESMTTTVTEPQEAGGEGDDGAKKSKYVPADSALLGAPLKAKIALASERLTAMFKAGKSEYDTLLRSMTDSYQSNVNSDIKVDGDNVAQIEEAIIPMLTKKVEVLSKALELSQLKAQAITVQLVADRAHHEELLAQSVKSAAELQNKLLVEDARNRLYEQMQRDPNMVSNVVTRAEHDLLKKEKQDVDKQLQERSEECARQRAEISTLSDEGKKAKAELMEAGFKLEQLSSQVSSLERKVEVGEDRLKREVADYEARIAQMQEQAKDQAAKIRENDKATDALKQQHEAALRQANEEAERQSDDYKKQMTELQKQLKRKVLEQDSLQEKVAKSAAEAQQHLDVIRNLTASLVQLDAGYSRKRAELENRIVEQRDRVKSLERHVSRVAADAKNSAKSSASAAQTKSIDGAEAREAQKKLEAAAAERARKAMQAEAREKQRDGEAQTTLVQQADAETQASLELPLVSVAPFTVEELQGFLEEEPTGRAFEPELDPPHEGSPMTDDLAALRQSSSFLGGPGSQSFLLERSQSLNHQLLHLVHLGQAAAMASFLGTDGLSSADPSQHDSAAITAALKEILVEVGRDQKAASKASEADQQPPASPDVSISDSINDEQDQFGGLRIREESLEELEALKAELRDGSLSNIGVVSRENFERLRGKDFGSDVIVQLTSKEHLLRYDQTDDDDAASAAPPEQADSKTQLRLNMMQMERDSLEKQILALHSLEDLARFKQKTENTIAQLATLNALKKVAYYRDGGLFLDVLIVHRDVLDRCILAGGGWPAALEQIKSSGAVTADTAFWPDFFRVRVLEHLRSRLLDSLSAARGDLASARAETEAAQREREEQRLEFEARLGEVRAELEELKNSKRKALKKGATALLMDRAADSPASASPPPTASPAPAPAPEPAQPAQEAPVEPASETSVSVDNSSVVKSRMKAARELMKQLDEPASETLPSEDEEALGPEQKQLALLHPATDRLVLRLVRGGDSAAQCIAEAVVGAVEAWRKAYLEDAAEALVSAVYVAPGEDLAFVHAMLGLIETSADSRAVLRVVDEVGTKLGGALALVEELHSRSGGDNPAALKAKVAELEQHVTDMQRHEDEREQVFEQELASLEEAAQKAQAEAQQSAGAAQALSASLEAFTARLADIEVERDALKEALAQSERLAREEKQIIDDMALELEQEHATETTLRKVAADFRARLELSEAKLKEANEQIKVLQGKVEAALAVSAQPPEELMNAELLRIREQIITQRNAYNEIESKWRAALEEVKELRQTTERAEAEAAAAKAALASTQEAVGAVTAATPSTNTPASAGTNKMLMMKQKFKSVADLSKEMAQARLTRLEKEKAEAEAAKERQALFEQTVAERVEAVIRASVPERAECGTQTAPPPAHHGQGGSSVGGSVGSVQSNKPFQPFDDDADETASLGSVSLASAGGAHPALADDYDEDHDDHFLSPEDRAAKELWAKQIPQALPLPPGFALVHVTDQQLELCPGVTLAVPSRLEPWERSLVPKNVLYCYRDKDAALSKGLKRLPRYVKAPQIKAAEAIIVPQEFDITTGVTLIQGFAVPANVDLDPDIFLVKLDIGAILPAGMVRVELLPHMNVPIDVLKKLPPGTELVQTNLAVALPSGVTVSRGVTTAAPPADVVLPFNLSLIRREKGERLPSYMVSLVAYADDESETSVHHKMTLGVTVVKKQAGVVFPPGMEMVHRPAGIPLPPGMELVPVSAYPEGLVLGPHFDLVMLTPRFDFPDGCLVADGWRVYPRPDGVSLPPGASLFQYDGEHGGAGLLPSYMKAVPLPDAPHGLTLPPNVLAAEFMPGMGQPLPVGSILSPGITVLSLDRYLNGSSKQHLPCNAVIVRRDKGAEIPLTVERGSRSDLPAGIKFEANVEVHLLCVRFELPPGVKLDAGVVLGRGVQLSPGTVLSRDLEVLRWPWGVTLSPGTELVKLLPGRDLPHGYHQAATQPKLTLNRHFTPHYHPGEEPVVIKLPSRIDVHSSLQLAEMLQVVDVAQAVERRELDMMGVVKGMRETFDAKEMLSLLPPGALVISRHRRSQLPSELVSVPKSRVPDALRRFCAKKKVSVRSQVRDIKSEARGGAERIMEVVQCRAAFELPPGVELAPRLTTLEMPVWLRTVLPRHQWLELVHLDVLETLPEWFARRVVPSGAAAASMPPNTAIVAMPDKFSPHSWGANCHGLEAVHCPDHIHLPPAHFLVQRPRRHAPPFSMGVGLSGQYASFESSFPSLPPGVEIVHLYPRFSLPACIALESTACLALLKADESRDRGIVSTIQLSSGQPLSPGVTVAPLPYFAFPLLPPSGQPTVLLRAEKTCVMHPGASQVASPAVFALTRRCSEDNASDPFDGFAGGARCTLLLASLPQELLSVRERLKDPRVDAAEELDKQIEVIEERDEEDEDKAAEEPIPLDQRRGTWRNSVGDVSRWMRGSFILRELDKSGASTPFRPSTAVRTGHHRSQADRDSVYVHASVALPVAAPASAAAAPAAAGAAGAAASAPVADSGAAPAASPSGFVPESSSRPPSASTNPNPNPNPNPAVASVKRSSTPSSSPLISSGRKTLGPEDASSSSSSGSLFTAPDGSTYDVTQPSQAELLRCLEVAQDEIHALELENNSFRKDNKDQKQALARQLKKVERLEDRLAQTAESTTELVDKLASLEGKVALAEAQVKIKSDEVAKQRNAGETAKLRLQAQVDVLSKQLALWMDANDLVLKERHAFLQNLEERQRDFLQRLARAFSALRTQCDGVVQAALASLCLTVSSLFQAMERNQRAGQGASQALEAFISAARQGGAGLGIVGHSRVTAAGSVSGSTIATLEQPSFASLSSSLRSPSQQLPPLDPRSRVPGAGSRVAGAGASPLRITDSSTGAEILTEWNGEDEEPQDQNPYHSQYQVQPQSVPHSAATAGAVWGGGSSSIRPEHEQGLEQGQGREGGCDNNDDGDDMSVLSDISAHSRDEEGGGFGTAATGGGGGGGGIDEGASKRKSRKRGPTSKAFEIAGRDPPQHLSPLAPSSFSTLSGPVRGSALETLETASLAGWSEEDDLGTHYSRASVGRLPLQASVWPRPPQDIAAAAQAAAQIKAKLKSSAVLAAEAEAAAVQQADAFLQDLREEFLLSVNFEPEAQSQHLTNMVGKAVSNLCEAVMEQFFGDELTVAERALFAGKAAPAQSATAALRDLQRRGAADFAPSSSSASSSSSSSSAAAAATDAPASSGSGLSDLEMQHVAAAAALVEGEKLRQSLAKPRASMLALSQAADKPSPTIDEEGEGEGESKEGKEGKEGKEHAKKGAEAEAGAGTQHAPFSPADDPPDKPVPEPQEPIYETKAPAPAPAPASAPASAPVQAKAEAKLSVVIQSPAPEPPKPSTAQTVAGLLRALQDSKGDKGAAEAGSGQEPALEKQLAGVRDGITADLASWASYVERLVRVFCDADQARYKRALDMAESEVRVLLKQKLRGEKRIADLEVMLIKHQQRWSLPTPAEAGIEEAALRARVLDLEECVDRLRGAAPCGSMLSFVTESADKITALSEMERQLQLHSFAKAAQAAKEEAKVTLGSGGAVPLASNERRAVLHRVQALRQQAALLKERAKACRKEQGDVSAALLQDMEAYQRAVQEHLPRRVILDLLSWSLGAGAAQQPASPTVLSGPPSPLPCVPSGSSSPWSRPGPREDRRSFEDGASVSSLESSSAASIASSSMISPASLRSSASAFSKSLASSAGTGLGTGLGLGAGRAQAGAVPGSVGGMQRGLPQRFIVGGGSGTTSNKRGGKPT